MGPSVLAEVSCLKDDAHLGYVIGEGPNNKTGLGKSEGHSYSKYAGTEEHYYSTKDPGIKYVINSASLQFVPIRNLSAKELDDFFPEKPKNVIHYNTFHNQYSGIALPNKSFIPNF